MNYKVGDKVVCINDNFDEHKSKESFTKIFVELPVKDTIYTIREYDSPSIKLQEIKNPNVIMNIDGIAIREEGAFNENRFAPILTLGMDMFETTSRLIKKKETQKVKIF